MSTTQCCHQNHCRRDKVEFTGFFIELRLKIILSIIKENESDAVALLLSQQNRPWYHTNKITFYWEICIHSVFCSFVSISDRTMMRRELKCLLEFQPIFNEYKWANLTSRFGSVKEYWNKVFDTVAVLTVLVINQTKIMIKLNRRWNRNYQCWWQIMSPTLLSPNRLQVCNL